MSKKLVQIWQPHLLDSLFKNMKPKDWAVLKKRITAELPTSETSFVEKLAPPQSPYLPQRNLGEFLSILYELAKESGKLTDKLIRFFASHADTPAELVERLSHDDRAHATLANRKDLSDKVVSEIARERKGRIGLSLLKSGYSLNQDQLEYVYKNLAEWHEELKFASSISGPRKMFQVLAKEASRNFQLGMAVNKHTPKTILENFKQHEDSIIRLNLLTNASMSQEYLRNEFNKVKDLPHFDGPKVETIIRLTENPNTPSDVLQEITERFVHAKTFYLLTRMAGLPGLKSSIADQLCEKVLELNFKVAIYSGFLHDSSARPLIVLLQREGCPKSILEHGCNHPDDKVRTQAVLNSSMSTELLRGFVNENRHSVIIALAANEKTPPNVLERISRSRARVTPLIAQLMYVNPNSDEVTRKRLEDSFQLHNPNVIVQNYVRELTDVAFEFCPDLT